MSKTDKATKAQTRLHNQQLILNTIYNQGTPSRAEISRITGLARPTVSELVLLLIGAGIVEELGLGPSEGGKRPTLLKIVDNYKSLIGLDLSKHAFQGCLMDIRGNVLHRITMPLNNKTGEESLQIVYDLIDQLIDANSLPLLGIGIGTPGSIDAQKGVIRRAVNLGWFNLPLRDLLNTRYQVPVHIANDSQMAAMAEFTYGIKREQSNLIVLKAGRGVSAGIILNGQLHYGEGFGASEIGHVRVVEKGKKCACGHFGCLETVVSSRVIVEMAIALSSDHPQSILAERTKTRQVFIDDVIEAYQHGDEYLHILLEDIGRHLGSAVANLISALNVKHVVFAGSVSGFGAQLRDIILREVRERSIPTLSNDVSIELSTLGDDIVIKGATAILLANELGII
jgi:N-acetylglucosamine repressor